jgi:hypothetical protein
MCRVSAGPQCPADTLQIAAPTPAPTLAPVPSEASVGPDLACSNALHSTRCSLHAVWKKPTHEAAGNTHGTRRGNARLPMHRQVCLKSMRSLQHTRVGVCGLLETHASCCTPLSYAAKLRRICKGGQGGSQTRTSARPCIAPIATDVTLVMPSTSSGARTCGSFDAIPSMPPLLLPHTYRSPESDSAAVDVGPHTTWTKIFSHMVPLNTQCPWLLDVHGVAFKALSLL